MKRPIIAIVAAGALVLSIFAIAPLAGARGTSATMSARGPAAITPSDPF